MTPRQRVFAAMAGEMPDHVPFCIWNNKLPGGEINQRLLSLDTCIINKSTVYQVCMPEVKVEVEEAFDFGGFTRKHITYHTPAGDLTGIKRVTEHTVWAEKMAFSGPEDYETLEALIKSKTYTPCYEDFQQDDQAYGEQSIARPTTILSPIQEIIYHYMGIERFCIEWAERKEHLLHLCDVVAEDRRKRLKLLAASPALYGIIEANIAPEIWGMERFQKYCIPYIEEACDILHAHHKWAGAHLDGNNRMLAPLVAKTSLDFIESFTPPPDCDLSLREARQIWSKKTILLNFPSSVHLRGPKQVKELARQILHEAAPGDRFVFGVSENIPGRGLNTLVPLARLVHEKGRTPLT